MFNLFTESAIKGRGLRFEPSPVESRAPSMMKRREIGLTLAVRRLFNNEFSTSTFQHCVFDKFSTIFDPRGSPAPTRRRAASVHSATLRGLTRNKANHIKAVNQNA